MEIFYSKKQIQPLIDKFKINVETNDAFKDIIVMFNEQTNYQVWAIKAVFGNGILLRNINIIKNWIDENQTDIQHLIKGNIVSYKTVNDFDLLLKEIDGQQKIKLIKSMINRFNTDQRVILNHEIIDSIKDFAQASASSKITFWFQVFKGVLTLPKDRIEKLISTSSALRDIASLSKHIENALKATYTWNKEDMLGFFERNCQHSKIVYDNGNIVVVEVGSFSDSQKLCGGGRTGWCLTREERYFKQYVSDYKENKQYFLFDFSKRECEELAHIGFTVKEGHGIVNAHSTKNSSLCSEGIKINGEYVNIHKALEMVKLPKSVYIHLKPLTFFEWNVESFLKFISQYKTASISMAKDNRYIINVLDNTVLKYILSHTLIDLRAFPIDRNHKVYVMFDFNLSKDDDNCIVALSYEKDSYNFDTLTKIVDAFNVKKTNGNYLSSLGITSDMYLNREVIDAKILLHKLIDENNEAEAIKLIEKEGDDFNVNYEFNDRKPIFSAIANNMCELFNKIVSHKTFDYNQTDPLGENILQSLMYMYLDDSSANKDKIKNMIDIILSKNDNEFDFNSKNINDDTAINIAAENPKFIWILENLISRPNININVVNDFNCTVLGNAIRKKNIEGLKLIGRRHDLVVREDDLALAKEFGINLEDYIDKNLLKNITPSEKKLTFAEIFAQALANC